tara:strand:+ start:19043 stop:19672 length:630 start_codon:yes stop_codon:yes gene_type:complete
MASITKEELLKTCETGDILLYNSKTIMGRAIEYFTGSLYSHVSMILRDPTYIDPKLKGLYIIESGMENIPDSLTGKKVVGVQIIPLEHALDYYKGSLMGGVYYRKTDIPRDTIFTEKIKAIVMKTEGVKYDLKVLDWFRALFDVEIGNRQLTNRFWCSALLAYIYVELGLLDKDLEWSMIEPKQFSFYENKRLSYKNCEVLAEKQIINI